MTLCKRCKRPTISTPDGLPCHLPVTALSSLCHPLVAPLSPLCHSFFLEAKSGVISKIKKPAYGAFPQKNEFSYNESRYAENVSINLRGRVLAFTIFLYYFIENGTLGLIPPKYYMLYRNIRISDFIL